MVVWSVNTLSAFLKTDMQLDAKSKALRDKNKVVNEFIRRQGISPTVQDKMLDYLLYDQVGG